MAGKKLLVADDSLTIQKVIRLALSNEGYEIQAISDGADAIQQIATFRPHAVLIDVSLPTRSAFEIKREINELSDYQEMKFILMSSAFEKIDEAQAGEVGFDGRLTKPFDPAHLRQVLAEVLAHVSSGPPPALPKLPQSPRSFPSFASPGASPGSPPGPPPVPMGEDEADDVTGITLAPPKRLPPADFDQDIWGKFEEAPETALDQTPDESAHSEPEHHDEIKLLTESTIRLSGLADFPEPEISHPSQNGPPKPPLELPQVPQEKDEFEWTLNEPSLKPPTSFGNLDGSEFKMAPAQSEAKAEAKKEKTKSAASAPPRSPSPSALPLTPPPSAPDSIHMDDRMEEVVRRQVEQTLEKLARQILPEVAERVIKEEINRLLNEKF